MTHDLSHSPGQLIRAADVDRSFDLLRNAIDIDAVAVRRMLQGQLQLVDMSPPLQAVILQNLLETTPTEQTFIGDGVTTLFTLSALPIGGSDEVFLNGQLMRRGTDYTLASLSLTFATAPSVGDWVFIRSKGVGSPFLILLGSFQLPYQQIREMRATLDSLVQHIFTYGTNKTTLVQEVAKFEAIGLSQLGTAVDVDAGAPDGTALVLTTTGGAVFLWAVGDATGAHRVTKIDVSTMIATPISMSDPATVVVSLATDNDHVYAFMKGGATLQANSVQKVDAVTNLPVAVIGPGTPGVTTTGFVDTVVSQAGALYVSYSDVNLSGSGEVRKFDANTGALLKRFTATDFAAVTTHPIRLIAVLGDIYVLDDLNQKIYKLSALDAVTTVATFAFVPTDVMFDLSDLWVSATDTLYKVDLSGTVLSSVIPQTGKNIQDVMSGLGLVWTSYSNDTLVPDNNIAKIFPGLPGTA
jgi:hypothetical protein